MYYFAIETENATQTRSWRVGTICRKIILSVSSCSLRADTWFWSIHSSHDRYIRQCTPLVIHYSTWSKHCGKWRDRRREKHYQLSFSWINTTTQTRSLKLKSNDFYRYPTRETAASGGERCRQYKESTVFIPLTTLGLIKFLDLESGRLFEVGAYSKFKAGRLLNFHHFQQVKYVYFATKQ